jgi:hypothetical protein
MEKNNEVRVQRCENIRTGNIKTEKHKESRLDGCGKI